MIMTGGMLSTKDIAEMFNVHPRTVIRWIDSGILPAYKTGRDYKIEPHDIETLKNNLKVTGGNDG